MVEVLVAVGAGAAVVGAGAGVVAGGARVAGAEVAGAALVGAALVCGAAAGAVDVAAAAPVPAWADDPPATPAAGFFDDAALCDFAWPAAWVGAWLEAGAVGVTTGVVWLAACIGAVFAKTVAMPTVASAPSWVTRQVIVRRRRSPSSRWPGKSGLLSAG
ncbi:hypothetical protein EAS64_34815 [Trebonia kvetii]|uniref:Uncharacterized protein n=1 Tax=Trebonia kvetii TaxID=2480626 RepID=A0A6P2BNI7_9ACTN|nr:hypothetical protein EAS64_34815 [Trebonia kvetii]